MILLHQLNAYLHVQISLVPTSIFIRPESNSVKELNSCNQTIYHNKAVYQIKVRKLQLNKISLWCSYKLEMSDP